MASLAPLELLPSWQLPEAIPCALEVTVEAHDWRAFANPAQTARWDALAQWAAEPNPFHESWYLLAALRALDPQGEVKLLCLEAGGQLAGLLPVRRAAKYYGHPIPHLANWLHGNAFVGTPRPASIYRTPRTEYLWKVTPRTATPKDIDHCFDHELVIFRRATTTNVRSSCASVLS